MAKWNGEELRKTPVWLTDSQLRWLDLLKTERRYEVATTKPEGEEMPQVSRSSVLREWIDEQMAKETA